jgi:hypothetical protein
VQVIYEGVCADCHSNPSDIHGAPDFLGLTPEGFYDSLVENTAFVACDVGNSILLLKGNDPGHAGPALTEPQALKVRTWLELEADARFGGDCGGSGVTTAGSGGAGGTGGSGPVTPLTGEAAMQQFGDCMTLTDWVDSGMPLIANQQSEYLNNQVPCYACHNNFQTGENAMPNPNVGDDAEIALAFEFMRHMYASFNLVRWTTSQEDGSFVDLVPSYRWRDKGQEGTNHPSYTLDQIYLEYYEDWFQRTYDRWQAGECDPGGGEGGAGGAGGVMEP